MRRARTTRNRACPEANLLSESRPGVAQAALAMACILDSPRAVNQQRAAAKVLAAVLNKLRSESAQGRRGPAGVGADDD
jgi:hypothetical protein